MVSSADEGFLSKIIQVSHVKKEFREFREFKEFRTSVLGLQ